MKLVIKADGINDEAIKVLTKAVKRLYKPYVEHYMGCESFEIKIGGEEMKDDAPYPLYDYIQNAPSIKLANEILDYEIERIKNEVRTANKIQPRQDGHDMGLQPKER